MAVSSEKKSSVSHNGLVIQFDDDGHVYRVFDQETGGLKHRPLSVTTIIGKYKRPFDLEGLSAKCAAEEGVAQDEIKSRWATESKTACRYGTKMHSVAERLFNGEFVDDSTFSFKEKVVFAQIQSVVKKMRAKPYDWESEKIVFDPKVNVAGTIDLLGRNRETGSYILLDWKTNKQIRMDNEWGKTLLSPVDGLPECEMSTYGLQLAMYERILKEGGFIDPSSQVRRFICHLHPETGVNFHEVDSKYDRFVDLLLDDWVRRNQAMNDGIPAL